MSKGKLIIGNDGQYDFLSKNGIQYSIYEGMTLQASKEDDRRRSDILFIVCDSYPDVPSKFVNFVYGASFLLTMEDDINDCVDYFEQSNVDFIEEVKKAKEF